MDVFGSLKVIDFTYCCCRCFSGNYWRVSVVAIDVAVIGGFDAKSVVLGNVLAAAGFCKPDGCLCCFFVLAFVAVAVAVVRTVLSLLQVFQLFPLCS